MTLSTINNSNNTKSVGARDGLMYLLVGSGIGAAVALLFAPKPGAELRTDISDITRKGYDGVLDLADTIKIQSADMVGSLKAKKVQLYDFASTKFNRSKINPDNKPEDTKSLGNDNILETDFEPLKKTVGAGRGRSSSIL